MGLGALLLIALILLGFSFWTGIRRYWRIAAAVLLCLAALAIYSLFSPVPVDLNESDRMGNHAARLIVLILALGSGIAFCAGFAVSILRDRKTTAVSKAGIE